MSPVSPPAAVSTGREMADGPLQKFSGKAVALWSSYTSDQIIVVNWRKLETMLEV